MGLAGSRVFLDSCIAIYLIEEHQVFAPKIETLLESHFTAELTLSDLTVMECLIGPLRSGNKLIEQKYLKWFEDITVFSVTNTVFKDAAKLRALNPSLKTPDAIHLATALHYNCDELWTNDERLQKIGTKIVKTIS